MIGRSAAEALTPLACDPAMAVGNARLAIYDSIYPALAIGLDCRLVTADRAFHDALGSGRHGPRLAWIADPI